MATYGLMIDYEWCSGCQSCEIACRNEHGWELDHYGIKVLELGPLAQIGEEKRIDWAYIAVPTSLCDLCADRVGKGGIPTCQLHCLSGVIEYGDVDVLSEKLKEKGKKVNIFIP